MLLHQTHAKINLFLHIIGKREDGFHLLQSLVTFVETGDTLSVGASATLELVISGRFSDGLSEDYKNNLVLKAARLLQKEYAVTPGATLTLEKHLPIASGIGGGSSDAAAALRLLNTHWRLGLNKDTLATLAARLGSDIPACVYGKTSWMEGVGERLTHLSGFPVWHYVLVNPGEALSTPLVYKTFSSTFSQVQPIPIHTTSTEWLAWLRQCHNDLEAPARQLLPVIGTLLDALNMQPGCALSRMSGSGATCFGVFLTQEAAENAARALAQTYPDWWIVAARGTNTEGMHDQAQ